MKVKRKTHKSTVKRVKITGNGKITRSKRRGRNYGYRKPYSRSVSNTDLKNMELDKVESKKVKRLLNI